MPIYTNMPIYLSILNATTFVKTGLYIYVYICILYQMCLLCDLVL